MSDYFLALSSLSGSQEVALRIQQIVWHITSCKTVLIWGFFVFTLSKKQYNVLTNESYGRE